MSKINKNKLKKHVCIPQRRGRVPVAATLKNKIEHIYIPQRRGSPPAAAILKIKIK
jgi:hypothetical protein